MLVGNDFLVTAQALPARNPGVRRRKDSNYIPRMTAMDRVIASMSPDDTFAALGLLKLLEERGQMQPGEAHDWRRRIVGLVEFRELEGDATPTA